MLLKKDIHVFLLLNNYHAIFCHYGLLLPENKFCCFVHIMMHTKQVCTSIQHYTCNILQINSIISNFHEFKFMCFFGDFSLLNSGYTFCVFQLLEMTVEWTGKRWRFCGLYLLSVIQNWHSFVFIYKFNHFRFPS